MSNITHLLESNFSNHTTEQRVSLEALMDFTVEPEVSNEGVVSDVALRQVKNVKDFFGDRVRNFREGSPVKLGKRALLSDTLRKQIHAIEIFYQNPGWLDRRRFVEGEVSAKKIASYLSQGGELRMDSDSLQQAMDYVQNYVDAYHDYATRWFKEITPLAKQISMGDLSNELLEETKSRLGRSSLPDVELGLALERKFVLPLGGRRIQREWPSAPIKQSVRKLPALSRDEVMALSSQIHAILTKVVETEDRFDKLNGEYLLSFGVDPKWSGWRTVEEKRHGKGRVFEHGDQLMETQDNAYAHAAYAVTRGMMTDPAAAESWTDVIESYFSGETFTMQYMLNSLLYDIAHAMGRYIDRSMR